MNTPSEMAVVGAVISSPDSFERAGLRSEQFFDIRLRAIWSALTSLRKAGKPVDEITLADTMGTDLDAAGGFAFLGEVVSGSYTVDNIPTYSEAVRSAWLTRETRMVVGSLETDIAAGKAGESLLEGVRSRLDGIYSSIDRDAPTMAEEVARQHKFALESSGVPQGLPTDLGLETHIPGGIPRAMVTTLFSAPGNMKSTLKNHLMLHWAKLGFKVLDVSLEDPSRLTAHRILSRLSGVPYGRINAGLLTAAEKEKISSISPELWAHAENITDGSRIEANIGAICRQARKLKATGGLDAICIDYIGLLARSVDNMHSEMGIIIGEAKRTAMELNAAIIFVAQEKQFHKGRPDVKAMYGSDAMRQESKVILGIYHPKQHHSFDDRTSSDSIYTGYNKDTYNRIVECHVLKNVMGPSNRLVLFEADAPTGRLWAHHRSEF